MSSGEETTASQQTHLSDDDDDDDEDHSRVSGESRSASNSSGDEEEMSASSQQKHISDDDDDHPSSDVKDPGKFPETSPLHTNVKITLIYLGQNLHLPHEGGDSRDDIKVLQHHSGENICVYKGRLLEDESFSIVSRRHHELPFSLTFYINGYPADRVSACCEYKHHIGTRLVGETGHFRLTDIEGATPCDSCLEEIEMDKEDEEESDDQSKKHAKGRDRHKDLSDGELKQKMSDQEHEESLSRDAGKIPETSPFHTNVKITIIYVGNKLGLLHGDDDDSRDEIKVLQPHSGENICVYKGRLTVDECFSIVSRRHRELPFSLIFYINGIQVDRVSACCEYRHHIGRRLVGKTGYFKLLDIEGATPCDSCNDIMGLDKKQKEEEEELHGQSKKYAKGRDEDKAWPDGEPKQKMSEDEESLSRDSSPSPRSRSSSNMHRPVQLQPLPVSMSSGKGSKMSGGARQKPIEHKDKEPKEEKAKRRRRK